MARGIDERPVMPFYEKEEVKSIGHRHTLHSNTNDPIIVKQVLLKLTELVARRLRTKNLVGRTVSFWIRYADMEGLGAQTTIPLTMDGLDIFNAAWKIFYQLWDRGEVRMVGVSIANLQPALPQNLSMLPEANRQETIIRAIDKVNNKYGEFTLQRGILLESAQIKRMPNSFLSDRRFKI
jgi:DNA polymerase-4